MSRDLWGEEVKTETKVCRDCQSEKPIEQFSINRKFYREDLPDKHYAIRRPSCDSCRSKKRKVSSKDKKYYARPKVLVCPICNDTVDGNYARLDHCHSTGVIRGWLCDNCNTALGKLKESKEVLKRAIKWMEKNESF